MIDRNYSAEETLAKRVPIWIRPTRAWIAPALAAVVASGLTIALAASYYSPLIGEWEEHTDDLAADVALAELRTDEVEDERDTAQASLDAAEARATDAENALTTSQAGIAERETALAVAEADVAEREVAVAGTEQQIADSTIREGRWTVGVDVAPGFYRVTNPVTSNGCYWAITVTGSNGDDIESNDFGTQGNLSVTLREGQDFETSDCGSWALQP